MSATANAIEVGPGPVIVPIGILNALELLRISAARDGVEGVSPAVLAAALRTLTDTITPVTGAAKSWDTAEYNLGVTHALAACDITLPSATQVANWVPGASRLLLKQNVSVFGINLLAPADVRINGGALDADASPISGSLLVPAVGVNAPFWRIFRESATDFWLFGYAS